MLSQVLYEGHLRSPHKYSTQQRIASVWRPAAQVFMPQKVISIYDQFKTDQNPCSIYDQFKTDQNPCRSPCWEIQNKSIFQPQSHSVKRGQAAGAMMCCVLSLMPNTIYAQRLNEGPGFISWKSLRKDKPRLWGDKNFLSWKSDMSYDFLLH